MSENRKTIFIASGNENKIREFREMLEPAGYSVQSLKDLKDYEAPEETGTTFEENAVQKAQAVTDQFNRICISDDSGLEIDALNREPGVHSARWMGKDTSYLVKNQKILDLMKDQKNRTCRYVCVIALCEPGKKPVTFRGECECEIALQACGNNGFGYDPIVYYPPMHQTMAQMEDSQKNSISHRGRALALFREYFL